MRKKRSPKATVAMPQDLHAILLEEKERTGVSIWRLIDKAVREKYATVK